MRRVVNWSKSSLRSFSPDYDEDGEDGEHDDDEEDDYDDRGAQ